MRLPNELMYKIMIYRTYPRRLSPLFTAGSLAAMAALAAALAHIGKVARVLVMVSASFSASTKSACRMTTTSARAKATYDVTKAVH